VALLLLRVVSAVAILAEARLYVTEPNPSALSWFVALSAFAAGALILVGFLTPVAAAVAAAGFTAVLLSALPTSTPNLFDSRVSVIFALTMLVTIIGIGPGAMSLDARMFGRREIIIPPSSSANRDWR